MGATAIYISHFIEIFNNTQKAPAEARFHTPPLALAGKNGFQAGYYLSPRVEKCMQPPSPKRPYFMIRCQGARQTLAVGLRRREMLQELRSQHDEFRRREQEMMPPSAPRCRFADIYSPRCDAGILRPPRRGALDAILRHCWARRQYRRHSPAMCLFSVDGRAYTMHDSADILYSPIYFRGQGHRLSKVLAGHTRVQRPAPTVNTTGAAKARRQNAHG